MTELKIAKSIIAQDRESFLIAELSANHNQSLETAIKTIEAAKDSGANAIKLQTFTPDTITIDSDNEYFRINQGTIWDGDTLYNLYKQAFTPWEWHEKLKKVAEDLGLVFFSTPFDPSAVEFLENLGVPAYKVASFEITDIPLIELIATKGKPIIISTGIASLSDIFEAIQTCYKSGNHQVALLKCTSSYPAPYNEANLRTIPHMAEMFDVVAGLSDHTMGVGIPIAAVALGARIIEKHFILDRNMGGPDSKFSMEPSEFRLMAESIRNVEQALGQVNYELSEHDLNNKKFARSLFIVQDIRQGEPFTADNVRSIRPGDGLSPKFLPVVLEKKANKDLKRGSPLNWDMIT
ncbi:pseudaminic acid synthase [Bacteroidota bacterium]